MLGLFVKVRLMLGMLLQQCVKSLPEGEVNVFGRLVGREAGGVGIEIVLPPFQSEFRPLFFGDGLR